MSDSYETLLDATIDHLLALKEAGASYLNVRAETLKGLQTAVPAPAKPLAEARPAVDPVRTIARPVAAPQFAKPEAKPSIEKSPTQIQEVPLSEGSGLSKEARMAAIRAKTQTCLKCPNLVAARRNVVFGVGNINADLMFIGEAPGMDEDIQGEPFVGAAGQLLTKIIQAMGLSRETVYIANILKCRPDTPGQTTGNRKPTPQEMQTCVPFLKEQIDVVKPKVLVALGATAVEGLLKRTEGITRLRGHFQTYCAIPIMPTYHPAYLLHNQAITEKRKVWEDMLQVMERLNLPISDKQRGFFLRG